MTRIDFHSNVPDKLAYACRLVRKAYAARNRVVLMTDDAEQLADLDLALWTFSPSDFLPHVVAGDALEADTPIILTYSADQGALPHTDLLVNVSRRTPLQFSLFQRVIEVISSDEADAAAGRQRYMAYKRQDHQLTHFVAGKS